MEKLKQIINCKSCISIAALIVSAGYLCAFLTGTIPHSPGTFGIAVALGTVFVREVIKLIRTVR